MDCHTQSFIPVCGQKRLYRFCYHWLAAIYCTTSVWTKRMSTDEPMWYSFPNHVMMLQKLYGLIPVLPTTSDWMEAKMVFPEQCHRKCGERKMSRYTTNSTQGAQKYLCKLHGSKGHYASNCSKPQVSSLITKYEKGI